MKIIIYNDRKKNSMKLIIAQHAVHVKCTYPAHVE